ncbi:cache domain-containing sensor histidine kinase [Paenibacillus dakarensis]|uniref:cache domain-containing sensor histidine kinase n=1 Tax=Paenibacillus dakarensis TaxID=1527293 RepID=UPI0006D5ABC3|nr:histidine kinase [Paenibacillus dakarensis]
MNRLKQRILHWSLEKKLIAAFSAFIVLPLILIAVVVSSIYVENYRSTMVDAVIENNRQIMKNIDTSLQPLQQMSMLPIQDEAVYSIMRKDYNKVSYPLLEKGRDFDKVNNLIQSGIMLYSDLIDSVVIYHEKSQSIIGRSNREYMNFTYFEEEFIQEPFIKVIREASGGFVAAGVHEERLLSRNGIEVVSLGRAVMDPYTKEDLGFILFNISVDKLKTLWSNTSFSEKTKFYLIDENDYIVHSTEPEEIDTPASAVLSGEFRYDPASKLHTTVNREAYIISSFSDMANWKTLTIIPRKDLFLIVYQIIAILAVSLILLLVLSILISAKIAKTIMKPLAVLKRKMKLVSQGNLDVTFDTTVHGEIGVINTAVDQMLRDIRSLIERIYVEEEEKRNLEMTALQSQIRPHFIYNTLNVIKWMAKIQGASGIEEALQAFSSVMKFTAKKEGDYVTIAEEVEFIENYTKILDFRYFNKFDVIYDIDPEVMRYKTLKFLLQPLVENSVFHGFEGIDYKGTLVISIHKEQDSLIMKVTDNGRGFPDDGQAKKEAAGERDTFNSIGLNNIRSRIDLHFGPEYGLWIDKGEQGGTVAWIKVPIIEETAG